MIAGSSIGTCKSDPKEGYPSEPYAFTSMIPGKVVMIATPKGTLMGTYQVCYEERVKGQDQHLN